MSYFMLDKSIGSCCVTKNLLESLEDYLIETVSGMTRIPEDEVKKSYLLSICHGTETEKITSASEYSMCQFPDETVRIYIELNISTPEKFHIFLDFNKKEQNSRILMEYESKYARETIMGMYSGIEARITPQLTLNKMFHKNLYFPILLAVLTGIPAGVGISQILKKEYEIALPYIALALIISSLFCVTFLLKPYISFQSNRSSKLEKWSDWLTGGLLCFLVFDTLYYLVTVWFLGR